MKSRLAFLSVVALLTSGCSDLTGSKLVVRNQSSQPLQQVSADFGGVIVNAPDIPPGASATMSGEAQRDGDFPLTFHKAGVRTVVPLGYITPNIKLRCTVVVTDADVTSHGECS
jgi:hypothetical protein